MTYNEKFEIALMLEEKGITINELENLQMAIYMKDQELINSNFAYLQTDLENMGITPQNLSQIIKMIYSL